MLFGLAAGTVVAAGAGAVLAAGAAVAGLVLARLAAQAGRTEGGRSSTATHDRRATQAGDMGAGFGPRDRADDLGSEFGKGTGASGGAGPTMRGAL